MRVIAICFTVLFVLFAALQFNDPDPILWVPIYLAAAGISLTVIRKKYNKLLYIVGMIAYFLGGFYYLPHDLASYSHNEMSGLGMRMPFVEEAREAGGLFICFVACTLYLFHATSQQNLERLPGVSRRGSSSKR
jgi:hypothetical protein